jgi:hypothetical protein
VPQRFGPATLIEARADGEQGAGYTVLYSAGDEQLVLILGLAAGAYANTAPPDRREPINVAGRDAILLSRATDSPAMDVGWQDQGSYQLRAYSRRLSRDELQRVLDGLVRLP